MRSLVLLPLAALPLAAALPTFDEFKVQFNKQYADAAAEEAHKGYYEERVARLEKLNEVNEVFGVTPLTDRKDDKAYKRGRAGRKPHAPRAVPPPPLKTSTPTPTVDWRTVDKVLTPIKNQGQCGSCWAFSATETIESAFVLAGGPPVSLSPQQIASCTSDIVGDDDESCCDGCGGGDTVAAYEYLLDAGTTGLAPEPYYPYEQGLVPTEECETTLCTKDCGVKDLSLLSTDFFYIGPYATIGNYSFATPACLEGACAAQNLTELAARAAEQPVSICVNAANWDDYTGGVMTASTCGGMAAADIDHCVQLVGYDSTASTPYWIVRNSWSTSWGEDGYIRLQFDENTCGLADEATIVGISGQFTQPSV